MNKPNILFIMMDQLRYDSLGFSGQYPVQTPNLDQLASESMWFERAFTPIPTCCPARQALINGRRPETFGALWNFKNGLPIPALEPSEFVWPRELGALDYYRVHLGKWDVHPERTPLDYGYDAYVDFRPYKELTARKYPGVQFTAGFAGERNPIPAEDSQTHWLADQACRYLEELTNANRPQTPWYMQLNFTEPHLPCRPSEPYASMYKAEDMMPWGGFEDSFAGKPYIQKQQLYSWQVQDYSWKDWAPIVARYFAVISQTDAAIGKVLDALEQSGAVQDTLVIFTADHGDMCGSHRMMDKHYILYDDVVRVPLIVKAPWLPGTAGTRCGELVCQMLDLPPTLLELLGLPIPSFFAGSSIVPLLSGETPHDWREEIVSTYNGQQFGLYTQRMLRTAQWKYIWNTTDIDELYDLEQDPYELTNRIRDPQCRDRIERYRKQLYDRLLAEGDRLVDSEWMRNQLLHNLKLDG